MTKKNIFNSTLVLLIGFGLGYLLHPQKEMAPMSHNMSMGITMNNMVMGLEGKSGDDFDKAFIEEMIAHHEGAISMAQLAKDNAKHLEIRDLSDAIITAQTEEISSMKTWFEEWYGEKPSE